jgi:signal transduction histidine kinase
MVDLSSLARGAVEEKPRPGNVTLDLHLGEGLNDVSIDPLLIRRVLDNLIRNGVEAMPDGGVLTVSARRDEGNAVIEVGDTGVGVSEEDKRHLFEPLFTRKKGGLGLGLYFVRMAVDAHGGVVDVNSKVGEGTTFKLLLPV